MPRSARYASSSSWAWQRRRRWWVTWLAEGNVIACPRCGLPVTADHQWDLDHQHDDGDDANTRPAHAKCNRAAGAALGNHQRAQVTRARREKPGAFSLVRGITDRKSVV